MTMVKNFHILYCKAMIYDEKEIKKRFGTKVREYRKLANLTQEKLAELSGCSWQTISGIETGYSFPSSKTLFNISFALKMPLVYLFNFYSNQIDNESEAKLINIFKKLDQKQQEIILTMLQSLVEK